MFSEFLKDIDSGLKEFGRRPALNPGEFLGLLEKSAAGKRLTREEIVELLNGTYGAKNKQLLLDFAANLNRPRRQEILLLPPLYFSSICENSCLYCDFSVNGIRLSTREFSKELQTLLKAGYRSIELVSSQDPGLYLRKDDYRLDDQKFSLERVIPYFEIAKKSLDEAGGGMLTSNIPPVDGHSLHTLKKAGLDCHLIWLETFDPVQYALLHRTGGPKRNQKFRLDSIERALDAGIPHVAGAFLKGLSDWRREEACLYLFDQYLKKNKGHGFSIIGTPRLKGRYASSPMVRRYRVSDQDYELNLALDRVLFDGILWLQTRERFSLNRKILKRFGAGVILTITCSTAPGGYHKNFKTKAQFPVFKRQLVQSIKTLEQDGFTVRFDWDSQALLDFQRTHGMDGRGRKQKTPCLAPQKRTRAQS
jgi:2-iminoacetate synthase